MEQPIGRRGPVRPGMHPKIHLRHFNTDEKTILNNIAKEWYIPNGGGRIWLGATSRYKYCLIKPLRMYEEMFNLDREIVVLFSPYETFETRTIDAVDIVTKRYPAKRVDRICSVLISGDNKIRVKLQQILKDESESQIIIPFTYGELCGKFGSYFIRNRFSAHFYTRDLFAFEAALRKDLYFFGRNNLVHKLVNRHKTNENNGLFGLRKTGKTSIIFAVQRVLKQDQVKSVWLDCSDTSFHLRRWNEALHHVIDEIKKQNSLNITTQTDYSEINASMSFEADLKQISQSSPTGSTLLAFDEVENITFKTSPSPHWRDGSDYLYFWQSIRSVFQRNPNLFTFLVVGTNPISIETPTVNNIDNPIFNLVPFEYIPQFTVAQTEEMVYRIGRPMGLRFDDLIYGKLKEGYGGHPYLIRHVCSLISKIIPKDRPFHIDRSIYEKAMSLFNSEYSRYFDMILGVLKEYYPDEFAMLEYLARGDLERFNDMAIYSPHYTSHLLGYGIVQKGHQGYIFEMQSIKEYLANLQKYQKMEMTESEMWVEISQRRNNLEKRLRNIVRMQLVASCGRATAVTEMLKHMKKGAKYTGIAYNDLFDTSKVELYFDDLKKVILANWETFKNIFENKENFTFSMESVNKLRKDAHAGALTMDELALFRIEISKLESQTGSFLN